MAEKTGKPKIKRASKSQRTYIRRLKQTARKAIGTNAPQSSPVQTKKKHKKADQS